MSPACLLHTKCCHRSSETVSARACASRAFDPPRYSDEFRKINVRRYPRTQVNPVVLFLCPERGNGGKQGIQVLFRAQNDWPCGTVIRATIESIRDKAPRTAQAIIYQKNRCRWRRCGGRCRRNAHALHVSINLGALPFRRIPDATQSISTSIL